MTEKKQGGLHFAFVIFAATCCFYAAGFGLISSIAGVYMLPVSESIGVGRGDFALWMAAMGIAQVISMQFWGNILATAKNFRLVMTISCLLELLGLAIFIFANALWMFIVGGVIIGVGVAGYYYVGCPMLINNWFGSKHRGKYLGIACAFIGIGGMIGAPVFTMLIQTIGWRMSYAVNLVVIAILCLPWVMFVVKRSPEDMGLKPYGYDPAVDEAEDLEPATKPGTAMKTVAFWALAIACCCAAIGLGYNSSQPAFVIETFVPDVVDAGTAAMIGATLITIANVGNIVGKVLFGVVTDRFGIKAAFVLTMFAYLIAVIIWLFVAVLPIYYLAAFLFGMHNPLTSVFLPLMVRKLYGNKNFSQIYSRISLYLIVGPFATTIVGWMYQASGNYELALWVGLVLVIIMGVLGLVGISYIGKIPRDDTEGTAKASSAA